MADLSSPEARRRLVERAYAAGIRSVAPDTAVRRVLKQTADGIGVDDEIVPVPGRLIVVAIGKAATPMAVAARDILGESIDVGFLLTKVGHATGAPAEFSTWEASHPVPDHRGIAATSSILGGVEELGASDVVLALISGGGSALFEAPVDGLTLDDIQRTTDLLLRAGAPIQHLNAVRSELSQVKGGGFRRRIGAARTVSLILSDVLGNSPEIIASGPTVIRDSNPQEALSVLDRYEVTHQVPSEVREHLGRAVKSDRAVDPVDSSRDLYRIIGDNERFVDAVQGELESAGLSVDRYWREREGEARQQAVEWVRALSATEADAIVGGGELTVTVRGDGIGGRNTEFSLAAAIELQRQGIDGTIASLASDGQDGGVDAAGAVVDDGTVNALASTGIDPAEALERNDSGTALGTIDALVAPGPTGTNVNDVYIGIRARG